MGNEDIENLPYHRKYRPNTMMKYIGNQKLKETAMSALKGGKRPQVILLYGDSGCGKAQPLDSLVLTTSGYKRMGDICIGDEVFTHEGNRGKVSGIYPQGVRPIYRIYLSDKTYIDVSDEHLNCVYRYNIKLKQREDFVLTTKELLELNNTSKYKLRIDLPSVSWEKQDVSLDPYLLGVLLGDGSLAGSSILFSNSESDIVKKVDTILRDNYKLRLKYISGYDYRITSIWDAKYYFKYKGVTYKGVDAIKARLKEEGYPSFDSSTIINTALEENIPIVIKTKFPELVGAIDIQVNEDYESNPVLSYIKKVGLACNSRHKFIPREYLFNSKDVRLNLLRGLFDTDGTVSKTGLYEFSTSSKALSDDFSFLVRSLGIRDTLTEKTSGYRDDYGDFRDCDMSYRHYIKVSNDMVVFTSEKHLSKWYKKQNEPLRNIISIKYIGDKECQCIMIDHPDHTYISDFFIPTHNTTFARLLAKEYSCENRDDEIGACCQCDSCQSVDDYIATGSTDALINIKEIDITDQSGKNDLSAVLEDMMIPTFGDEWKVYILDEVHMATPGLQNRLLKITEEPPEHVLILLCTTNPEKLLPTLKNRCQLQLHVTKPKIKELAGLLRSVCENEGVDYDQKGLEFIANRGELTIRTALQNLNQVVTEQNSATYDSATKVFETVSNTILINIFSALKSKDIFKYVTLLYEIKNKMELSVFLSELRGFVTRGIYTINGVDVEGVSDGELSTYRKLFGDIGVAEVSYLLTRLLQLDTNNLEIELLTLGYQGLSLPVQPNPVVTDIITLENETKQEELTAKKVLKEKEEVDYQQGLENANNLMQDASIEAILALGGSLIEN